MKYVHVANFQTAAPYANQQALVEAVRAHQNTYPTAFNLVINKHTELKLENKLLSRELTTTNEGARLSRTFNSLSDALEFDTWYKSILPAFDDLHVTLGWVFESTNIITITDERWAEIQPIANVDIQAPIS